MTDIMQVIRERHSTRSAFDPHKRIPQESLKKIIEAARWAPTAHNMQNFEIVLIDENTVIETIGKIESVISEEFIRENFEQLSMSEEELKQKKVGILGMQFPPKWTDPLQLEEAIQERKPSPLSGTIRGGNTILLILYDKRKRAPASEGDVLGLLSLGCVMENIWLMAQALGISVHIMSAFGSVQEALRKILDIPEYMELGFACKLGYPVSESIGYVRVRRDMKTFIHHNRYGNKDFA
jgi:nitroreductase